MNASNHYKQFGFNDRKEKNIAVGVKIHHRNETNTECDIGDNDDSRTDRGDKIKIATTQQFGKCM